MEITMGRRPNVLREPPERSLFYRWRSLHHGSRVQQHRHTDGRYPGNTCTGGMANARGLLVLSLVCLLVCQVVLEEAPERGVGHPNADLSPVNKGEDATTPLAVVVNAITLTELQQRCRLKSAEDRMTPVLERP
ncbi:hypothetical protein LSAT2_028951 [Lamellibrachia satsuma]|nr:hypothetical protein LSAT2_028951 [Lamellibrachia satsuma]